MSDRVSIVPANAWLARAIAKNLRAADEEELLSYSSESVEKQLISSIKHSQESWVALVNDEPVAIFGLAKIKLAGYYAPWMVGTDYLTTHPVAAMRIARQFISEWRKKGTLINFVYDHHEASKRWLAVLGFELSEWVTDYGDFDLPFRQFVMKGGDDV